jgi:predicted small metal-binding protein
MGFHLIGSIDMFELKCRDVGFDCAGVVVGATREDVLRQAAVHASTAHRTEITPEMAVQVAALIREQDAPAAPT